MNDYKPANIFISTGVINFLTVYKNITKTSIIAQYQLAIGIIV